MGLLVDNHSRVAPTSHIDWRFCYYLVAVFFFTKPSAAGQLVSISINEIQGEYVTRIVAIVEAPADYVFGTITDYKHIYRINPSIVESELLPVSEDHITRVRNRVEHCIAVFCFEVEMVEDVVVIGDGHLLSTIVPGISDFESGSAMWHIRPFGDGRTRIQYRSNFKPDFFVPPFIGSLIIKSKLREDIVSSFSRIECNAIIMARNDRNKMLTTTAGHSKEDEDCTG
jgi:hypothetical protein